MEIWYRVLIKNTLINTFITKIGILHLLANDCYRTGQFLVAAKAFDILDKYDPSPDHAAAKRGACVGLFQMILAGREHREAFSDIIHMLRSSTDLETGHILQVITNWAKDNRMKL